jgi:hypothetical protein
MATQALLWKLVRSDLLNAVELESIARCLGSWGPPPLVAKSLLFHRLTWSPFI